MSAVVLTREVRALSQEVARLRAIVDWEKALEDVPIDTEELRPEFVRKIGKQIDNIRTGKEPIYYFDTESFRERVEKERACKIRS